MNKILLLLALLLAVTSAFDTTTRVRGRRTRKMVAKGQKVHGKKQTTPSTKYPVKKGKSSKSSKAPTVEAASGVAVDVSEREVRRDTSLPFLYKHAESLEDLEMLRKNSDAPSPTPTVFFPEKSSASEASSPSPTIIKNASTKAPTITSKHPSLLKDGDEDCSPVSYTQPDEREYVCANDESYESPFNGSCGCELFEGTDCNAWIALLNETQVAEIWTRCPESCGACSTEKGLLCSDDPTYRNPMNENIGCGLFDNNCDGEPWIWSFTESQIAEAITRCPISCGVPCPKASSSTPSSVPTERDSSRPTNEASDFPSLVPSSPPSVVDTSPPSQQHSLSPSNLLSSIPSSAHSNMPSSSPSLKPSFTPTGTPSFFPTKAPSFKPSNTYTDRPSNSPSSAPTQCTND
ncbi:hypothetical protein CTEN210_06087 [Chaetoceros tenuissimus]|uniref:ShKT domain-containing protein n=1 Tax=Chaetoceros tenuissimus TaxID=426638 RepID=A0AAD3CR29_9STRA|nr:hypothetical protein CTEN210_06087 [Chaetoceros tenuissimus]